MGKTTVIWTPKSGMPWIWAVVGFLALAYCYADPQGVRVCSLGQVVWIEKGEGGALVTTTIGMYRVDADHSLHMGRSVSLYEDAFGNHKLVDSSEGVGVIKGGNLESFQ